MAVGQQPTQASINGALTQWALNLRNDCQGIGNFFEYVNGLGLAGLEALGFDSTDAQTVLTLVSYLNTVAEVYKGTATQASEFDFDNALSVVWGGS